MWVATNNKNQVYEGETLNALKTSIVGDCINMAEPIQWPELTGLYFENPRGSMCTATINGLIEFESACEREIAESR